MDVAHIETIPFYENIVVKTSSESKKDYVNAGVHTILPNHEHCNYIIRTAAGAVEIDFRNKQDKLNLDAWFCRGSAHICNVKSVYGDGTFLFDFYAFAGSVDDFGKINVLADREKLNKLRGKNDSSKFDEFCSTISKCCSIELDGKKYLIIQGDYEKPEEDKAAEAQNGSGENQGEASEKAADDGNGETSALHGAFSILCEHCEKCFAIKIRQKNFSLTDSRKYFAVEGVSPRRNIQAAGNFHLIKAELEFSDRREAANEYNLQKLEKITQQSGSYLKAWKEYTCERGERILAQARSFDAPRYKKAAPSEGNRVILYFDENIADKIEDSAVEEIMIYENKTPLPLFLQDKKCSFSEYCEKKKELKKQKKKEKDPDSLRIVDYSARQITVVARSVPPEGYAVMSMIGEETQIERHQEAWEAVSQGKAGISCLGNLLEGDFDFMPSESTLSEPHITNRVREKIFRNPPTDRQLDAIRIALKTPDIALIQGPPGTGKTTVITAILEILNEAQDKRGVSAGRVLATSYQHDAVENMISRIRVNSLPAWKFGSRRDRKNYSDQIDEWCEEIEKKVFEKNPDISVSQEETTFRAYIADYCYSPLPENRERLLEYIQQLPVKEEIASEAREFLHKNGGDSALRGDPQMLRTIRALRITEKSFADDGARRAEELYFALDDDKIKWFAGHSEAENLLMDVMNSKPDAEQLEKLGKLRLDLLEEFSPKPLYIVDEVDDRIIALCGKASDSLEDLHGKKDKKEQILADWIQALHVGSEAFARAIKDCDFVYAATSQQSVGADIRKQKKAVESNYSSYIRLYDTVIIDEAARATPPDLLIPMCNAVKRIILVGDHRQLPQLVDDDICEGVYQKVEEDLKKRDPEETFSEKSEDIGEIYENAYKLSLFELLFKKLKDLEKIDGIKRTITLNRQFRTHPVLGKFCSRLFYEPYGEGYESPRPAEEFAHSLPGIENKAAVWIDVPKETGNEQKCGTSRRRECEADCIVEKFMTFVRSQRELEKEKKLSFGIIAFYSAQRDLIQKKLNVYGDELTDVNYKVGTVDAFQGMEFDVVFLSIVRTGGNIDFLTPNRLCVSMSRQKKVLVAVGCKDFATSKKAREQKIPALSEFYDLCAGKNDEGYGEVLTWKK